MWRPLPAVTHVLTVLLSSFSAQGAPSPLDGIWHAVEMREGRDLLPQSVLSDMTLTIRGSRYVLALPDGTAELGFSSNEATQPSQIDLMPQNGANRGRLIRGVYTLRNDVLTIAYAGYDQPRPVTLAPSGSEIRVTTWYRISTNHQPLGDDSIRNSIGMEFRLIMPGTFVMGSAPREQGRLDEGQHRVTISRPFYIGTYDVTVGQYRQFRTEWQDESDLPPAKPGGITTASDGINRHFPDAKWDNPPFPQDERHPVVFVNWYEARAFCDWLSKKEVRTYRLPTEAEWEYAARGGAETAYWWGDDATRAEGNANITDETYSQRFPNRDFHLGYSDGFIFTAPVGSMQPNRFGLNDMIGNVFQWVQDWWQPGSINPERDPVGPSAGQERIAKGGGWASSPYESRVGFRFRDDPVLRYGGLGFRVLLQID